MTNIPHRDKFMWETPLDYSGSLKCILNPYSTFYWHPGLTADEYMRCQQYKRNLAIEDSRSEMENRDYTDSWMDSE